MLFNAFRHGMLNIMVFVKRTLSMNMIRSHMLAIRIPLDIELKKKIIVYQY